MVHVCVEVLLIGLFDGSLKYICWFVVYTCYQYAQHYFSYKHGKKIAQSWQFGRCV